MFDRLKRVKATEEGYLADESNIKYEDNKLIKTVDIRMLGRPFVSDVPYNLKKYKEIRKQIEKNERINAWVDAGNISEKIIVRDLQDMELSGDIYVEPQEVVLKVKRLKFYHIGE